MNAPDGEMSKVSQHNDQMGRMWPLAPEDGASHNNRSWNLLAWALTLPIDDRSFGVELA